MTIFKVIMVTHIEELFVVRGVLQREEELVGAASGRVRTHQRRQRFHHAFAQLLQRQRPRVLCQLRNHYIPTTLRASSHWSGVGYV
jgi:hypothetical protein